MTCGSTPREPSASTTPSPGICPCSSRRCTCPATRGRPCSPSRRNRAPRPKTRWHSSPAGRHRLPKQPPPANLPAHQPPRTCAPTRSRGHLTKERQNHLMTNQEAAPGHKENMTGKRVWFITGAGRGMGTDIAKAALAAGHAVVATGRNPERVAAAIGAHADLLAVKLDVTNPDDATAAAQAAVDRFGRVDVLVNNAGNFIAGFFEEISPGDFRAQVETN